MRTTKLILAAAFWLATSNSVAESFDIVLKPGRVIDPETNLDAIRDVGIRGDAIVRISSEPLTGAQTIDARGLAVDEGHLVEGAAPGQALVRNAGARPVEPFSLVGAWRSSLQFETGAFAAIRDLEFMYVFNAGGTLTESSNYDGAPPVPPAYGVWRAVGANEFEAKYEYFSTAPSGPDQFMKGAGWLPSGRGVFTERIKLSPDAQTFTTIVRYEALGPRGEPMEGGGEAKGHAVRIRF